MIKFYTTHCPKCIVLEKKLRNKNIDFETYTDVKELIKLGYTQAPMLEVDGEMLDFTKAIEWINNK